MDSIYISGGNPRFKQMVFNLIIFLLIVGAIYLSAYPDSELSATASAIRQLWSGSCRLSCQQSGVSGVSGLSGLSGGRGYMVAHSSRQGPAPGCVCEACPCSLIDNVLRSCRPATTMYSTAVDVVAGIYYIVIKTLSDMYEYLQRVMNCGTSCQRPQLIGSEGSITGNKHFGNKNYKDSLEKAKNITKNLDSAIPQSRSIVFKDKSNTSRQDEKPEGKPEKSGVKMGISDVTLKPITEKQESNTSQKSQKAQSGCPKCIEKGEVCMKKCPKAKKKK